MTDDRLCSHCLLPVGVRAMQSTVNGESHAFCCYGCCIAFQVKNGKSEEWEAAWLLIRGYGIEGAALAWTARTALDLTLYLLFFMPCMLGLIYAGGGFAADSWRIGEHSTVTAEGPPIYHFKTVIPIAGVLVMLQGLAEIVRCLVCLRTGAWPARLEDVEEIDVIDTQLGHSQYVDEESRRAAMEGAKAIDEAARHRSVMEEGVVHEQAIREDEKRP